MPADLDAIRVAGERRTLALVGIGLTLYLPEPHRADLRAAVAACIEEYRSRVRGRLAQVVFRKRVAAEAQCPPAQQLLEALGGERDAFSVLFTGAATLDEPNHYGLQTLLPGRRSHPQLGMLSITLPMSHLAAAAPGDFQRLTEGWCQALAPLHGYGGFTLVRSIDPAYAELAEPDLYAIVGRFPGLEIDAPAAHMRWCRDGFKSVNWLTVLGDALLDRLGGAEALRAAWAADPSIGTTRYDAGLIVQAGPYPQLGDAEQEQVPEAYRRVYRAVKAVQADCRDIVMRTPPGVDALAFARTWMQRFDPQ